MHIAAASPAGRSIISVIALLTSVALMARPFGVPDYLWAVAGAALLLIGGLLTPPQALHAVAAGADVYLFLTGMMLLAELARREGVFDWLAAHAVRRARSSPTRLFSLVFAVGTAVTIFLSNDATAIVLTPAVAAVVRAAKARAPLPYLLICAFVANAASFVLPISNPANLVFYGGALPPLLTWLRRYALASALSIAATYAVLRATQRAQLAQPLAPDIARPTLTTGGRRAAFGIAATALLLLVASAAAIPIGRATFLAGLTTVLLVQAGAARGTAELLKDINWGILPLVAALFVLVAALERAGVSAGLAALLHRLADYEAGLAPAVTGALVALAANLANNLPASLLAGNVLNLAQASAPVRSFALIGADLGPNLSVTGSLATLLWLAALRREQQLIGGWAFLRLGALIMPPALAAAFAGAWLSH